jgi:hypothetical protein
VPSTHPPGRAWTTTSRPPARSSTPTPTSSPGPRRAGRSPAAPSPASARTGARPTTTPCTDSLTSVTTSTPPATQRLQVIADYGAALAVLPRPVRQLVIRRRRLAGVGRLARVGWAYARWLDLSDDMLRNADSEFEAPDVVAAVMNSCPQSGHSGIVGELLKLAAQVGEERCEKGTPGRVSCGVPRGVGGMAGRAGRPRWHQLEAIIACLIWVGTPVEED